MEKENKQEEQLLTELIRKYKDSDLDVKDVLKLLEEKIK